MKDPALAEHHDTYPRSFTFADIGTQPSEKSLDLGPADCPAHGPGKDLFKRRAMLSFH